MHVGMATCIQRLGSRKPLSPRGCTVLEPAVCAASSSPLPRAIWVWAPPLAAQGSPGALLGKGEAKQADVLALVFLPFAACSQEPQLSSEVFSESLNS